MEENEDMDFGEWEINDNIWLKEVGKDKVQESMLKRPCREAHESVMTTATALLTHPG